MKNTNFFLLSILAILFFSCSEDQILEESYTEKDLEKIHGGDFKTWKIEGLYVNYESNWLSEYNDCYTDDLFTFTKDSNEAIGDLGSEHCFVNNPEQAITTLTYTLYEEDGTIMLNVSKTEFHEDVYQSRFFNLALKELTERKMFFAVSESGVYKKTLILTAVD